MRAARYSAIGATVTLIGIDDGRERQARRTVKAAIRDTRLSRREGCSSMHPNKLRIYRGNQRAQR